MIYISSPTIGGVFVFVEVRWVVPEFRGGHVVVFLEEFREGEGVIKADFSGDLRDMEIL